jgi:predicted PurR-regulated permease PerM
MTDFIKRITVAVAVVAAFGVAVSFLWYARSVFFLTFAGVLVAVLLQTVAEWVSQHSRLRYGHSIVAVILMMLVIIGLLGWFLEHRLADEIDQLSQTVPKSWAAVQQWFQSQSWAQRLLDRAPEAPNLLLQGDTLPQITGVASQTVNFFIDLLIIAFVGIYLAADPETYLDGVLRLVPIASRDRGRQVVSAIGHNVRWWLLGQLIFMTSVGLLTGTGLWLLGVRLALALGVVAFLLEIIPYVGPFLASVPSLLVAMTQGWTQVVYVLCLYLGIHVVEGYILSPLIQGRAVRLPPALGVLALVVFGMVGGLLGIVIAAPLTVVLIVLVKMLYIEDVLGDWNVQVKAHAEAEAAIPAVPGNVEPSGA